MKNQDPDPRPKAKRRLGRQCRVCRHAERERIGLLSVGGGSLESLGRKFGLSKDCIHRHMQNHVSAETKAALIAGPAQIQELAARAAKENLSTIDYLSILRSALMKQLTATSDAGDVFGLSRLATTLLSVILEIGKISGDVSRFSHLSLHQTNQNVFLSDPGVLRMQAALLRALQPFPDARRAVIIALRGLEEAEATKGNGHAVLAAPMRIEVELADG
jgi:hypothetical protein